MVVWCGVVWTAGNRPAEPLIVEEPFTLFLVYVVLLTLTFATGLGLSFGWLSIVALLCGRPGTDVEFSSNQGAPLPPDIFSKLPLNANIVLRYPRSLEQMHQSVRLSLTTLTA